MNVVRRSIYYNPLLMTFLLSYKQLTNQTLTKFPLNFLEIGRLLNLIIFTLPRTWERLGELFICFQWRQPHILCFLVTSLLKILFQVDTKIMSEVKLEKGLQFLFSGPVLIPFQLLCLTYVSKSHMKQVKNPLILSHIMSK